MDPRSIASTATDVSALSRGVAQLTCRKVGRCPHRGPTVRKPGEQRGTPRLSSHRLRFMICIEPSVIATEYKPRTPGEMKRDPSLRPPTAGKLRMTAAVGSDRARIASQGKS